MLPLPPGRFSVILADPPWSFQTYGGPAVPQRAEQQHYAVMSREALLALPVSSVAAKDCALVMWVVGSHFEQAFALGRAWGFDFKTDLLVWRKPTIGMGYWSRKETEQAWLFTRGKPKRIGKNVRQVIDAPRREHSRKPDEQYERIEALLDGPYLELFARRARPGWTVWGDQAPGNGFRDRLTMLGEAL